MDVSYESKRATYIETWKRERLCFTQHPAWGEVKRRSYDPHFVLADGHPLAVHGRKLPVVGGNFGYAPRAFKLGSSIDADWLGRLCTQICRHYKLTHLVIEPNIELTDESILADFQKVGFRLGDETIQPRHSRLIDLRRSDEQLLSDMSKDVRRRIVRAGDEGYTFEEITDESGLEEFYGGLQEVAKRAKFDVQSKDYFRDILTHFPRNMLHIYLCRDKTGQLLYATFVIHDGEAFRRIYGGPTLIGRQGDAAQFTAWQTIKAARGLKAKSIDLWGVAPYTTEGYIEGHALTGTSRFKASLGGRDVTYWPQLIWVADRERYAAYRMLIKTHRGLKRLKKKVLP